ncbi:hypothetical protein GCM10027049_12560 [Mucilaginibacter puniceus]
MIKATISSTRTYLKKSFDRVRNEEWKKNMLQAIPFWIASVITGLVAVIYTRLFLLAENLTTFVFNQHKWWLFVLTPVCFVGSWLLVKHFSPYARGSGIPQVMAAIEISNPNSDKKVSKLLSIRVIVVKMLSSLIMAIGGGAIGREGPTIQIAASIYKRINSLLPEWWPKLAKSSMIITGAAAGLAAAFNTPLGGIVFAIEELTKTHFSYFKTAIFSSVIIAGLTAQGMLGPYLYLGYPLVNNLHSLIFLGVILVAVLSGLAGSVMSKLILRLMTWKAKFKLNYHHVLYIVVCALIMVVLACFLNYGIMGSGKEQMQQILFTQNKHLDWYMPLLRILGPMLSFTTGAAGGIFAPALGAGASIGSLVSGWFQLSETNTNLLVLAGMVGFLTGVTRSPFTSTILVLEMTDRHNVIFHLILAGTVASLVAMLVDKHSFYDNLKMNYIRDLEEEEKKEQEKKELI